MNTHGVEGLCIEVHDLAISKYVAGREKDVEYTRSLALHGLTERAVLLGRLARTRITSGHRAIVQHRIAGDFAKKGARK